MILCKLKKLKIERVWICWLHLKWRHDGPSSVSWAPGEASPMKSTGRSLSSSTHGNATLPRLVANSASLRHRPFQWKPKVAKPSWRHHRLWPSSAVCRGDCTPDGQVGGFSVNGGYSQSRCSLCARVRVRYALPETYAPKPWVTRPCATPRCKPK